MSDMKTLWIDTTWSAPTLHPLPHLLAARASQELGEPRVIYPIRDKVRDEAVCALAVAAEETSYGLLPFGLRAFARRGGVWYGSFSWTAPERRRQGISTVLMEFALRDLPVVGLEGPFSPWGYVTSRALGRRYGLVPGRLPFTIVNGAVKKVQPDWSRTRMTETVASVLARYPLVPEPRVDLPDLEVEPLPPMPELDQAFASLAALAKVRGGAA